MFIRVHPWLFILHRKLRLKLSPALRTSAMLAVAACLLMGIVLSLSRMALCVLGRTLRVVMFMRGSPNWALACGLLGAFLAIAVHSLADFNLYVPANALAFAWLAGLSTGLVPGPSRIAS